MIEREADRAPLNRVLCIDRAGPHEVFPTIRLCQGQQGEALPYWLLLQGVNVLGVPHIHDDRHACIAHGERLQLCFAQKGAGILLIPARGDLHIKEREVTLSPLAPPFPDHGGEESGILLCPAHVTLALVPDHPPDSEGDQRADLGIVEYSRSSLNNTVNFALLTALKDAAGLLHHVGKRFEHRVEFREFLAQIFRAHPRFDR